MRHYGAHTSEEPTSHTRLWEAIDTAPPDRRAAVAVPLDRGTAVAVPSDRGAIIVAHSDRETVVVAPQESCCRYRCGSGLESHHRHAFVSGNRHCRAFGFGIDRRSRDQRLPPRASRWPSDTHALWWDIKN